MNSNVVMFDRPGEPTDRPPPPTPEEKRLQAEVRSSDAAAAYYAEQAGVWRAAADRIEAALAGTDAAAVVQEVRAAIAQARMRLGAAEAERVERSRRAKAEAIKRVREERRQARLPK